MRIRINFSRPVWHGTPYLILALTILMILSIGALLSLTVAASKMHSEQSELEEQLARYNNHKLPEPAALQSMDKLIELRNQVRVLNNITGSTGQTLPLVMARLEELMPNGVWLANMQYRAREGEIKLLAESDHAELLTDFMARLERSGYFAQVLLTRQSQRQENAARSIQFEIQLREIP